MEQNRTIQEETFQKLRKMIITTELEPGQKISESQLMKLLKVGRTPIRESIQQLKKQNLIYSIPQSGTYVQKIDLAQAINARFARECLECEIMIELTAKMDGFIEKELAHILHQQRQFMEEENMTKYFDLDNAFHSSCYKAVGKLQIWEWINQFNTHLDRFRWLHLKSQATDTNEVITEHEEIFESLKERNTEEVRYLTIKHLHGMLRAQNHILSQYPDYFTQDAVQQNN
jgi:DNA-binding GntR family transcriptional regulator